MTRPTKQEREEQILEFIRKFHRLHQWAPSVREIAAGVGIKSSATIQAYLDELQADGKIVFNGIRKVRVVD